MRAMTPAVNVDALRVAVADSREDLEAAHSLVYKRYRYTWFDYSAIALFFVPVVGAGLLLARRIWRLRQLQQHPAVQPKPENSAAQAG